MTEQEILEGNILIAGFMKLPLWESTTVYNDFTRSFAYELKYHSSFDSLVSVIEKINNTAINNYGEMGVYITPCSCMIGEDDVNPVTMTIIANHGTLIKMVYAAVLSFIQWFNTVKQ